MEKIVIWGTGAKARDNFTFFCKVKQNKEIIAFIDSDKNKWGTDFRGIPIASPLNIPKMQFDSIDVWTEQYYEEICKRLRNEYKIPDNKIQDAFSEIRDRIIGKYEKTEDQEIKRFINKMKEKKWISIYSFDLQNKHELNEVFEDSVVSFPYILFEGKRMYLKKDYKFINRNGKKWVGDFWGEQDPNSPHLYMQGAAGVHEGDILIDAGACEGNFSLHNIEKVSKLYIVECDANWVEALKYTFEPWKEKVVICSKFLGSNDSETTICIDSLVGNDKVNFIKMDIEGAELNALQGAQKTLQKNSDIRCAICAYHKHDDEKNIKNILKDAGFVTETSKGYMWFFLDQYAADNCELRHGIVRGVKRPN